MAVRCQYALRKALPLRPLARCSWLQIVKGAPLHAHTHARLTHHAGVAAQAAHYERWGARGFVPATTDKDKIAMLLAALAADTTLPEALRADSANALSRVEDAPGAKRHASLPRPPHAECVLGGCLAACPLPWHRRVALRHTCTAPYTLSVLKQAPP